MNQSVNINDKLLHGKNMDAPRYASFCASQDYAALEMLYYTNRNGTAYQ